VMTNTIPQWVRLTGRDTRTARPRLCADDVFELEPGACAACSVGKSPDRRKLEQLMT
jgi:ribosomal protein L37E